MAAGLSSFYRVDRFDLQQRYVARFILFLSLSFLVSSVALTPSEVVAAARSGNSYTYQESDEQEEQPTAIWLGVLDVGLQKLEIQFRVFESDEGETRCLMDSLSQNVTGIAGKYANDGGKVTMEFPAIAASLEGTLSEDGTELDGTWKQAGRSFPLPLTKQDSEKSAESAQPSRPQTPKEPFPYEIEEVVVHNEKDSVTLSGTLTLPKGDGPFPAAVLISGSGPQDRDETLLGHKPFWVIADSLTRRGIAVLRCDDRGVGKSTGDFSAATTLDFSNDAEACQKFLAEHDKIQPNGIGLIGHSEGGLVAPLVAVRNPDVAFIVLLAGPGQTGREIITSQSKLIMEAQGIPAEVVARESRVLNEMLDLVLSSEADADLTDPIGQILDREIAKLSPEEQEVAKAAREATLGSLKVMQSKWYRFFLTLDPVPTLEKVTCPVLAVIGEKDLQVPADANLEAIEEALSRGKNPDFKVVKLPELNHLFQHAETGSPTEYEGIEETFDRETLKMLADWILKRSGS